MAKVYVGYLYQIKEGEKPQRDQWKIYKEVEAANVHGGYLLFKKVPWFKRPPFLPFIGPQYAEELITGKRIPILADGMKGKIGGEHTFLKFDGTFKQRAKVATKEHLEYYQKYHPKKADFSKELEEVFKEGKRRANLVKAGWRKKKDFTEEDSLSDLTKNDIALEKYGKKKERKRLEEALTSGEYQQNVHEVEAPSDKFEEQVVVDRGRNATGSTVGAVVPTAGGQFIHPGFNVGMPGMGPGMGPGGGDFVDESFAPGFVSSGPVVSNEKDLGYKGENSTPVKTTQSDSSQPSDQNQEKKEVTNEEKKSVPSSTSKLASQVEEVDELGVPSKQPIVSAKKETNPQNEPVHVGDSDYAVRVSTTSKTEQEVVKELAKVAETGSVGITTLQGVELSTKFLKSERDLTEYFLYKRHGQTPTSQSVLAVIELENSMTLLNGGDTKGNTRSM